MKWTGSFGIQCKCLANMRLHTQILLVPVFLLGLLTANTLAARHEDNVTVVLDAVCEDVGTVAPGDQCAFVEANCKEESRTSSLSIDWLQTYYCTVVGSAASQVFFWVMVVFVGTILFLLLGDTAEKFFSPALTQIAMEVPKMRPRFSGVTLLAFANGAPDLSATINAIKKCKFDLSLGALTGAGMFVNCFVAGFIIIVSGGAKCRGATIRDVAAYIITVLGLMIVLFVGKVGIGFVVCSFLVYAGFVTVVFCADEWHEKGRHDFWSKPLDRVIRSIRVNPNRNAVQMESAPVWAAYDGNIMDEGTELSHYQFGPSDLSNRLIPGSPTFPAVWANYTPDRYRQQALAELAGSDDEYEDHLQPLEDSSLSSDNLSIPHPERVHVPQQQEAPQEMRLFDAEFSLEDDDTSWPKRILKDHPWLLPLWQDMLMEDWSDMGALMRILLIIRLPLVVVQRATIPMTSSEYYNRHWLVISMGMAPFFTLCYFDVLKPLPIVLAVVVGIITAIGVAFLTKGSSRPPRWTLGTSWPIGASIVAVYGLVMGVFWIDIIAGELVDLLHCVGQVLGIPGAIMGLTILAWGNSIGDFFTNKSVAKAGKGNMALTACYAGPVFNMLMGLGLGFLAFMTAQHTGYASVKSEKQILLGCSFLLLHCIAVIAVGMMRGFRLPKNFGFFSIGLYVIYLSFAIALELLLETPASDYSEQCKA